MKVKSKVMAALGSIKDHAVVTRATLSGRSVLSSIEIAVLRSTDLSDAPLDDKYIREILFIISNAPGSITFLARRITARLEPCKDPIVALKTLLLLHRLLRGGDRYFEQDLRSLWSSGDLKIDLRWLSGRDPDTLCRFTCKYSRFLEERMEWLISQAGKLEPIIPGSTDPAGARSYQEKEIEVVLHRISKCQVLLDRIIECCSSSTSTSHAVVQSAISVVLRESLRVYESFSEGVDVVFRSFLDLKKHTRVLALDVLRKACPQTRKLHEFYEDCKKICVGGKSLDYPSVHIITSEEISSMDSTMKVSKEEEIRDEGTREKRHVLSLISPFSQRLETKMSTVWVEFDEEDSQSSSFSFGELEDELNTAAEEQSTKTLKMAMELL